MTTDAWIRLLRRRLVQVDDAAIDLTDAALVEQAGDALDWLALRGVTALDGLAVDADPLSETFGFLTDPTTEQAYMLMLRSAEQVLEQLYAGRLLRGELGVSWRSGLEEESSLQAQRAYVSHIDGVREALAELILISRAATSGDRVQ
jgi:hypothetical protein